MIGTTLAHYRITAALGAGGMGEVYRATDTKLSREYDVSVDGQRVLLTRTPKEKMPREAEIVLNWFPELERLAGPGGAR